MRPGWKNRIDERRYFDELRARQRLSCFLRAQAQAQAQMNTVFAMQLTDDQLQAEFDAILSGRLPPKKTLN